MNNTLVIFLSVLTGLAFGIIIMMVISRAGLNKNQQKGSLMLKEAESKADSVVKQAVLDGRTQAHELKLAAEKEIKERKQEITDQENKLLRREDNLNFRDETLTSKEKQIDLKNAQLADKMAILDEKDRVLQAKIDVQVEELERIAAMSTSEAKAELFAITEKRMEKEIVSYIKEREEEAKSTADEVA
ncbi:MAG: Rnase Y domain-containing protein, partial [Longicatena sp.]